MCSLKLITYRNTIIIIIIDYLYCYYNWWQLASENPYGYSMCCLRTYCVSFSSIFYLYTESVYFILLCNMSNKILPYHKDPQLFMNDGSIIPYVDTCNHLGNTISLKSRKVILDNAVNNGKNLSIYN